MTKPKGNELDCASTARENSAGLVFGVAHFLDDSPQRIQRLANRARAFSADLDHSEREGLGAGL